MPEFADEVLEVAEEHLARKLTLEKPFRNGSVLRTNDGTNTIGIKFQTPGGCAVSVETLALLIEKANAIGFHGTPILRGENGALSRPIDSERGRNIGHIYAYQWGPGKPALYVPQSRLRRESVARCLGEQVGLLHAAGFDFPSKYPNAVLSHGDLWPRNVAVSRSRMTFFDFGDTNFIMPGVEALAFFARTFCVVKPGAINECDAISEGDAPLAAHFLSSYVNALVQHQIRLVPSVSATLRTHRHWGNRVRAAIEASLPAVDGREVDARVLVKAS